MALRFLDTPKILSRGATDDDASLHAAGIADGVARFMLPNVANPAQFCEDNLCPRYQDHGQEIKFAKGTTCLGFIFQGGVLLSVDSRATQGPYIASGTVQKVIPVNQFLLGTMAGGAADCSFWQRNLGRQCRLFELTNKKRITVRAASKQLHNTFYSYKGYGLSCGTMICGWDDGAPEGELYYVDSDGTRLQAYRSMPMFSVGSGSPYAYGVLDSNWRWDMTDQEAVELGQMAIYHATYRDSYSGGINNVYLVKQGGWTKIASTDVKELHERYGQGGLQRSASAAQAAAPKTE